VITIDHPWGEALVRFSSDVDPDNGLDARQVELLRSRLLGARDELVGRTSTLRSEIEAVTSALAAVDAGVYGICLRCRRPIGFDVLSTQPAARLCPVCASGAPQTVPAPAGGRSR